MSRARVMILNDAQNNNSLEKFQKYDFSLLTNVVMQAVNT